MGPIFILNQHRNLPPEEPHALDRMCCSTCCHQARVHRAKTWNEARRECGVQLQHTNCERRSPKTWQTRHVMSVPKFLR